jgi:hypothetical protein
MATFLAWQRPGAHALTAGVSGVRRTGAVQLQLTPMTAGAARTVPLAFSLFGAADVSGLRGGAVRHRHPAPGVADAAPELAAHVEFAAADLPWRYSPAVPEGPVGQQHMLPWLVLLAGADTDFVLLGRDRVRVAASVLRKARLERSHRWAHVHRDDGGGTLSRIVSPCTLPERTACRAALVPAYRVQSGTLAHAWDADIVAGSLELPLYDTWAFATGEGDDFPQLAAKLQMAAAVNLGAGFGTTTIRVRGREEHLPATGALMRPDDIAAFETPPPAGVGDVVASWPIAYAASRWVLAPPAYDLPWRAGAAAVTGWPMELLRDPRRRAAAGLGAWCAIDQQDQLADGARRQAGAIDAAAHDFRMLALGLAAGTSLWERRLPSDAGGRLAVLGPLLRRLPSLEGGTADRALRGRTPRLHPAVLSGAMRRTIRPGTALTVSAAPSVTMVTVLEAANRCPEPERPSTFTDALRGLRGEPAPDDVAAAVARWERVLGRFAERARDAAGEVWRQGRRLADGDRRPRPCRPVALAALGDALAHAVDPSRPDAPAMMRVRGRYQGIADPLPTPVFEPELDLPLAPVLTRLAPHWLLPGRGLLGEHTIVALATNPRFVESALAGANHRALAELRWRNVRVRSGWSPLRRFWPRPQGPDITPLRAWTGDLGHASHRPAGDVANLLVVVIRSPILRRYPGTGVYLLDPAVDVQQLHTTSTPPPDTQRIMPLFKGALEPDLHYVGFPRTPAQAAGHYLVFEEPMAEPRFRLEPPQGEASAAWTTARDTAANGAAYAAATFHRRTIAIIELL